MDSIVFGEPRRVALEVHVEEVSLDDAKKVIEARANIQALQCPEYSDGTLHVVFNPVVFTPERAHEHVLSVLVNLGIYPHMHAVHTLERWEIRSNSFSRQPSQKKMRWLARLNIVMSSLYDDGQLRILLNQRPDVHAMREIRNILQSSG